MSTNLTFGARLIGGFVAVSALGAVIGLVGLRGIGQVDTQAEIVALEEMPLLDAVNEMKFELQAGATALEEFSSATSVLDSSDSARLVPIEQAWTDSVSAYDRYSNAIIQGAVLEDSTVVATDNDELRRLMTEANKLHDDKFQPAAAKVHASGKQMLAAKAVRDEAMLAMEQAYDAFVAKANAAEEVVGRRIGASTNIPIAEVAIMDWLSESKRATAESRIMVEEIAQHSAKKEIEALITEYDETIKVADGLMGSILEGGGLEWHPAARNAEHRAAHRRSGS